MKKAYLITGATGFLGHQLTTKILEEGNDVLLIGKAKKGISFEERIKNVFSRFNKSQIVCIEADLETVELNELVKLVKNKVADLDGIWHLAANLSFKESDRKKVFDVNINSMKKMIELSKSFNTTLFHTSTAYVHGRASGTAKEEFGDRPVNFNNPYEESKFESEQLIKNELNLKYVIFRPSIMFDSKAEYVTNFGYYSFLIALFKFKRKLNINKNTRIFVPFPFLYYKKSLLNLMPSDKAIDWMYTISRKEDAVGSIFHICNPKPFYVGDIFKQTFKAFNLKLPLLGVPAFFAINYFRSLNLLGFFIRPFKPNKQFFIYSC
jgi:nucleoside-diphosphate-sugar epimerase